MSLIATKKPRFSPKIQREFFDTLKARVKDYFEDNRKSRFANANMVFKTLFMLSLYFTPFVLLSFDCRIADMNKFPSKAD